MYILYRIPPKGVSRPKSLNWAVVVFVFQQDPEVLLSDIAAKYIHWKVFIALSSSNVELLANHFPC